MRNGSERVVTSTREHIYDLRGLENYSFVDEHGKDQGLNGKTELPSLHENYILCTDCFTIGFDCAYFCWGLLDIGIREVLPH